MKKDMIGVTERGDPTFDFNWLPWVQEGNAAILITKDPLKLFNILSRIKDSKKFNIIIHTTITGFGDSLIVPNMMTSLTGYKQLCEFYSEDRIVLRIDPIVPTDAGIITAKLVLEEAKKLASTRVRISFIDQYDHVKNRFEEVHISLPWDTFHAPFNLRNKVWIQLGKPEVCGEPSFECTGCISEIDCRILNMKPKFNISYQRQACKCLSNKKELLMNKQRCNFKCLYCYWKDQEE
jgi:Domain of unknown function (DUF1848)